MEKIRRMIRNFIINVFAKEVKEGQIIVIWRDFDGEMKAWKANADYATRSLALFSALIEEEKQNKFEKIVGVTQSER